MCGTHSSMRWPGIQSKVYNSLFNAQKDTSLGQEDGAQAKTIAVVKCTIQSIDIFKPPWLGIKCKVYCAKYMVQN